MPIIKGQEWTFDTVATTYENMRPGYVEELYRTLFMYIPIDESSHVVEIGIGGGQATLPILKTGCSLTAVEYGEHFSELCREKFRQYSRFTVVNDKFEHVDFAANCYDLVYSASAFHWIPEEIGYSRVFKMLKSGGVFARFANHPYKDKENPILADAIDELYFRYYNTFYHSRPEKPREYSEEQAKARAMLAEKFGFIDIQYKLFYRTRTFTAKEYVRLLGTYSDHIAMDEPIRMEFFNKIEETINRHGGVLKLHDTIDLQLARKP